MPSAPITSDAVSYITSNWFASNFYAPEDISFTNDPIDTNSTNTVLKVNYPAGSYAPVGTKNGNGGVKGGAEFYSLPNGQTEYNTALLRYDVAFDSNFDWVKGGKLPGIFGGDISQGCSGGEKATGENCFSVRMMWREGGAGEAYAYIPTSDSLCNSKQVICNSDYGTSFSRGVIRFSTMKWSQIEIYVKLNSGSNSNGILEVWQDGSLMINQQNIQFRSNQNLGVSSMMFSTFFGGGSSSYATPVNTSTYFRNFQFSTGNTPDPVGNTAAASLQISSSSYYFLFLVVIYQFFT
ncbi:hypothetical protein G6F57_000491 [Rhizopus arrhizus]|uniref:Polysaccharide lyase 14 domain-containing protein n=1 Tax=Rhizopus oryzae TaxID=64495 RepID=A0A9P7BTB3_RHIOR|nr:hypothetical protein G6F23_001404 [Rhizopus arrhizus]KAG1426690.1 hypothetical protein G6F58_001369 [Rhizopus delemar]KAG0770370.1 hypothetical protein G6F24_000284 [Rhizopus arrhizus]KAG0797535.1 hypothetical protein G6F21_000459 [Rhizopus arrhizus]KAG0802236.1 hypothetical protein G6F22_000455 [Rhizopus arrhizus]